VVRPGHERRDSAKTRQWPLCRASRKGATAVDRRRRGNIPRLGADAIDTFRASRRVGRADESSSWPAVEGSVRFDVSRRRCARRAYVSTFRGDVAAAPWQAAALSSRGGDISPAGGGTLGEARWRSRRGYHVALAPQPRSAVCVGGHPGAAFVRLLALLDFVSQAATSARCRPSALDNPRRCCLIGLETSQRAPLLERRLRPAPPPLARRCRRNAATSRRFPTRAAALNIRDQCTTTSKSETSVTVKRHPGPSFGRESLAEPTASKEARMTYSAVHNLSRHVT